jgi:endonuclease/exonuclease/phosphatase family metal-dependent hydrolase
MRLLIASILLTACANTGWGQSLTVMTYNIRFDNPKDGVNAWPNRTAKVAALIQRYDPDVIGVQEALHHQLLDLLRILPDYSFAGVGRDDGKLKGEFSAILFRNNRFGLLETTTLWLSETPEVPGSKFPDSALPRIVTVARLYDKVFKNEINLLNTHFDHVGTEARKQSARLISGYVADLKEKSENPVLVTGDFNCEPTDEPYSLLLHGLADSNPAQPIGTFCGFEVGAMACKTIDYIFHTQEWAVKNYRVIQDNDGRFYPSDHLPVLVEFELTANR